ncbi:potassium transporter [Aspergillus brunneoviolaceus CBS 621.78]|uniref:Ankyrin repeat-containing protein n=1 Tax=Aspergillus brunneoviolaceus CBS 621.78 TaxID=1450534 RepID=A0ACD1GD04_9EURO|nr:ankyrin repeat-containing protein [Aspergillus brunneoviolaceus CBS 621.78]RAH47156.1 ankyrin repeat-containing protein [Aspergillus brunneoviolaceus CBS 621.78]
MPLTHEPSKSPLRRYHHYIYIIAWALVSSLVLYLAGGLSYLDALLLASGAATQTGLNSIDLNRLHVVQQVTLWGVSMVTNVIFINSLLVVIRLYWFRKRFRGVIHEAKVLCRTQRNKWNQGLLLEGGIENRPPPPPVPRRISAERPAEEQPLLEVGDGEDRTSELIGYSSGRRYGAAAAGSTSPHITFCDSEAEYEIKHHHRRSMSGTRSRRSLSEYDSPVLQRSCHDLDALPALLWQSSIASYADWDEAQKEELGGIEYRALKTLFVILVCYFVVFHVLGIVLFLLWVLPNRQYSQVLADVGISRPWWAIFTAGSAFNDLGFTLTPDSMDAFQTAAFPLLVMTFLVVVGNTGFPCMLRFIIWTLSQFTTYGSPLDDELEYLLEHPRRCFTLLFPSAETWRLSAVLLLLNAIDLLIFYTLQETPQNPTITPGLRLVNGLFQIASTRTAGFSITPLTTLHPATQVSFLVMMYISAFPNAIAIRKTNVYEERSLGIFYNDDTISSASDAQPAHPSADSLAAHIQRQLGFDLWYVMLGFFLIAVAEGPRLQAREADDRDAFALFPILFEIVSAYGTVGLSLGYPGAETSLCGQFSGPAKAIIIAMQVRGRHRGLPHALDHAILLPCEPWWWWMRWMRKKGEDWGSLFGGGD